MQVLVSRELKLCTKSSPWGPPHGALRVTGRVDAVILARYVSSQVCQAPMVLAAAGVWMLTARPPSRDTLAS
jgi:hypothetical protein